MGIHIHLPLQKLSCGAADAELLIYVFTLIHFSNQKTPPQPLLRPQRHPLAPIGFRSLRRWVYGASLGLLMTRRRVTYMNMEIRSVVHMLCHIAGLI